MAEREGAWQRETERVHGTGVHGSKVQQQVHCGSAARKEACTLGVQQVTGNIHIKLSNPYTGT